MKTTNAITTITAGLKADIEQMARFDFQGIDSDFIHTLHTCMSLIKIAKKTFPDKTWNECIEKVGMNSYRQINHFLEDRLTGRQKADLAVKAHLPLGRKMEDLKRFVAPPKIQLYSKAKDLTSSSDGLAFAS